MRSTIVKRFLLLTLGGGAIMFLLIIVGGLLLSSALDSLYRSTGTPLFLNVFYYLSQNRIYFVIGAMLVYEFIAVLWSVRPAWRAFGLVQQGLGELQRGDEDITLPMRGLEGIEAQLNTIKRDLRYRELAQKEAEQRKDDLVVYLAHDLRTPLTSVLGYLELLDEANMLPGELREQYTATALRKARRMEDLVEELFEVTRYNVSRIELKKQEVGLLTLINQVCEEVAPIFEQRGIVCKVDSEGGVSALIDADKMARVLDNILGNAARYAGEGGQVGVKLCVGEDGRPEISVSNTGSEIPQEMLARVFEKFYRGDQARQTGTGGSGLGLAIAHRIVEAHGGTLTANSQNGVTTFTIKL